jgi:hypothetical protein
VVVVASPSQGRTAAAQCGLFIKESVQVIFEQPFTFLQYFPNLLLRIPLLNVVDKETVQEPGCVLPPRKVIIILPTPEPPATLEIFCFFSVPCKETKDS